MTAILVVVPTISFLISTLPEPSAGMQDEEHSFMHVKNRTRSNLHLWTVNCLTTEMHNASYSTLNTFCASQTSAVPTFGLDGEFYCDL
jgi:hypothetical protein